MQTAPFAGTRVVRTRMRSAWRRLLAGRFAARTAASARMRCSHSPRPTPRRCWRETTSVHLGCFVALAGTRPANIGGRPATWAAPRSTSTRRLRRCCSNGCGVQEKLTVRAVLACQLSRLARFRESRCGIAQRGGSRRPAVLREGGSPGPSFKSSQRCCHASPEGSLRAGLRRSSTQRAVDWPRETSFNRCCGYRLGGNAGLGSGRDLVARHRLVCLRRSDTDCPDRFWCA